MNVRDMKPYEIQTVIKRILLSYMPKADVRVSVPEDWNKVLYAVGAAESGLPSKSLSNGLITVRVRPRSGGPEYTYALTPMDVAFTENFADVIEHVADEIRRQFAFYLADAYLGKPTQKTWWGF